jgi:2-C-methyl-D-erythritol 2,4-cyclodiphosphate synthase
MLRVGIGYDIHRLVRGRKLLLGGAEIPHEKGLAGHSDGDVLIHAIIDAVLGASNLGDIGSHFPDTDPQYKDIPGVDLLAKAAKMVGEVGRIEYIDATVVAQAPRLAQHFPSMKRHISGALGIDQGNLSLKAKTAEGVGDTGREQAIEAYAVATVSL